MKQGKLSNERLESLILSKFGHTRVEVVCSPGIGVDCAAVDLSGRLAVLSCDPITSAKENAGRLTVHINCNDAAAAGAEPIGLLITLLAPPSAGYEDIGKLADEIAEAAAEANVDIIGGHTEVTDSVTRIITSAAVIARCVLDRPITPAGMREGDHLVMTKTAGLEGTAIIAEDFKARLKGVLSETELMEARGFINRISVVKEGVYAARHGASAMHDITEGGVFGAAWEMAYASKKGICLDLRSIPVHPITEKICTALSIDLYRLISSGSMLISCRNGEEMVRGLASSGVDAAIIGYVGGEGVRLADNTIIEAPGRDELYKLFT